MHIFYSLADFKPPKNTIATIGTFDGLHLGYQLIINRITSLAHSQNLESVVLTFHPHPRLVLYPDDNYLKLLHTLDEKIAHFEKLNLDNLLIIPFTKEFSRIDSKQYIQEILVNTLKINTIVVGYDHRFGKNRTGSLTELKEFAPLLNYSVEEI